MEALVAIAAVCCNASCKQFWHWLQRLESGMADVISLDGGRISSKGITSGSGFRVAPLAEAPSRFGSSAPEQAANPADLQQQVHVCLFALFLLQLRAFSVNRLALQSKASTCCSQCNVLPALSCLQACHVSTNTLLGFGVKSFIEALYKQDTACETVKALYVWEPHWSAANLFLYRDVFESI